MKKRARRPMPPGFSSMPGLFLNEHERQQRRLDKKKVLYFRVKPFILLCTVFFCLLCTAFSFTAAEAETEGLPLIFPPAEEQDEKTPLSTPAPTDTPASAPVPTPSPEPFEPSCLIQTMDFFLGRPFPAEKLRPLINWQGALILSYAQEPDWQKLGLQGAALLIENEAGQRHIHPFMAQIVKDTEPPKLIGVHKLYAYLDESVIYMDGIRAEDNADGMPVITLDNSKVNTHAAGTYPIWYKATDYSGNSVSEQTEIVMMEPEYTEEEVYALADEVLRKITKPEMTTTEKLKAAFDWGRSHVKYGYGFGHSDWRRAAVMGFTKGRGDCFVFYATTRALLDRLGIPYVSMERLGGKSRHYWVLVNVGTGWYHFDTTVANSHKHKCFMWTDKQCQVKSYFWRYDPALCPKVATTPFDYKAQVAFEQARMNKMKNE